ncbi:hypothetical protein MNBD_BACTEROID07-120 [hydrothermal vent metagenome]|uniref:Uncharacterized protein n=1 Tax=hydrothermal vent metagenome TaxID=652676 RepID=A0A3B0V7P4_9ZZZZ
MKKVRGRISGIFHLTLPDEFSCFRFYPDGIPNPAHSTFFKLIYITLLQTAPFFQINELFSSSEGKKSI